MRILALDLGGDTGWAIGTERSVDASGTWTVAPRRGESPGMRYVHLRRKLVEILAAYPDLGLVAYEQAHHRGGAATEYAAGSAATVQAWCAEEQIEHVAVHTATLKVHATGNGRAKKPEMFRAAERFVPTVSTEDQADAICLLDYARREIVGVR